MDNDRNVVFCAALHSSAMFNELWFLTTGPLVGISVIFAEFPVRDLPVCLGEALLSRMNPIL